MSEKVEINGHTIEVEPIVGAPLSAVYSKHCDLSGSPHNLEAYLSFIRDEKPSVVVGTECAVISIDGEPFDIKNDDQDLIMVEIHEAITQSLPNNLEYNDLLVGDMNNGYIVLTKTELPNVAYDHVSPGAIRLIDEHTGKTYKKEEMIGAELERMHADRNDNNPVNADRLCGLLNHEGMADAFADFKASKGRLKMYSGGVSITPDGDVTVVSDRRGGDFIDLTEKEAKGLNRGDEVSLTRKSVDSEFNVGVLRQDRARELNLY